MVLEAVGENIGRFQISQLQRLKVRGYCKSVGPEVSIQLPSAADLMCCPHTDMISDSK